MTNSENPKLLLSFAAAAVAIVLLLVGLWMLSVFNILKPTVTWTGGSFIQQSAYAGEIVEELRDIEATRDVTVDVSMMLVRKMLGVNHVHHLPKFNAIYTKGQYKQLRSWHIPYDLTADSYQLISTACYQEFSMFERCTKLQTISIEILNTSSKR